MVAKELLENRWKLVAGLGLSVAAALLITSSYGLVKKLFTNADTSQLPDAFVRAIGNLTTYDSYAWGQWFNKSGEQFLAIFAILLGASLIAGEVSKGTIYLLLSRPLSRDHILLIKFGLSAAILLSMALSGAVVLLVGSGWQGHPQNMGGVLLSTAMVWLGSLLVLGLALVFSILLDDPLRAFAATGGFFAVLAIVSLLPGWQVLSPVYYWTSLPAYLGSEVPLQALVIDLAAAIVPLAIAVPLFRSRAY